MNLKNQTAKVVFFYGFYFTKKPICFVSRVRKNVIIRISVCIDLFHCFSNNCYNIGQLK